MRSDRMTIYDIATEAGVSAATVSRVLSRHPNVSAKTYEKVMRVVDKYQFTPSSIARGLYKRSSQTLGLILPGVSNPYYATLFEAAHETAREMGYSVLIYRTQPNEQMDNAFMDQLIERRLDGVLLLGGIVESTQPQQALAQALCRLLAHMPIVTICPPIEGVDCINFYSDLSASVRQSVRHLYALGHERIAFLGGSFENRSASEREVGFLSEMEKIGLSTAYCYDAGHTPEAGALGTQRLLGAFAREDWPTAIIGINDLVALGAMRQLRRMGLRIPEDMAIIGCDNSFFSAYLDPPLTSVDIHPAELGRMAIEQLVATINHQSPPFAHMHESTLIIRESCGASLGRRAL